MDTDIKPFVRNVTDPGFDFKDVTEQIKNQNATVPRKSRITEHNIGGLFEHFEKKVLSKYYKCKEDVALTAQQLDMTEEEVQASLAQVKINTGLDVADNEDNFKLHFITIAKKVLENDEKIKRNH